MIGRVVLAALLAGIAAGVIMGAIQHLRLTPFIIAAENFEAAGAADHAHVAPEAGATNEAHSHADHDHGHAHDPGEAWPPPSPP
jgi:predicted cobalt transporter CbtA